MNLVTRVLNTAYLGVRGRLERRVPFWPLERIQRVQQRRLRATVAYAYQTVPFYRRVMAERGLNPEDFQDVADLAKLPLINAMDVRLDPEQFVSDHHDRSKGMVIRSSRGKVLYWDSASTNYKVAYYERDRAVISKLVGPHLGVRELIIVGEVSTTMSVRQHWQRRITSPRLLVDRRVASSEALLDQVREQINTFRPQVVYSYGSWAGDFFRYLAQKGLSLDPPRVWVYGGDMLLPVGRRLMEQEYGCQVYSSYGASEAGRIAFQCELCHGFHVNIDLCPVRLVGDDGETVAPGELGEIVISNLYNRGTVLMNYRMGDMGRMAKKPCRCGRTLPLLEDLRGHYTGSLYYPSGERVSILPLNTHCIAELRQTAGFQIVQRSLDELCWLIVAIPGSDREGLRRSLVEKTRETMGQEMRVTVEFVEKIGKTAADKLQDVVQLVTPNEGGSVERRHD